jgi:hypothetical protein
MIGVNNEDLMGDPFEPFLNSPQRLAEERIFLLS